MKPREIKKGIYWVGAVDWDRRLFDSLIPLPDGTSYNAYLVRGSDKTVLLDAVDPSMENVLLSHLQGVEKIDYLVSHHAEQDHSGTIPKVLEKYGEAKIIATPKGKALLMEHLPISEEKIITVEDGETLSLGDKTLKFIYLPWVHWPETMVTYLQEDKILFTCDFFGSHLATNELYADEARVYEPAKRYYAEIMMPYHNVIKQNLEKIKGIEIAMIAPSHGPVYSRPKFILDAYREWVSAAPKNLVVLPFVSMHGSTEKMAEHLAGALTERGVEVELFNLAVTDLGKLAMALVDAATVVIGSPTMLGSPHPSAMQTAYLVNILKPKARFLSFIGSYGWGGRSIEQLKGVMGNLKVETLEPVLCKGLPRSADFHALDKLADTIAAKHREQGFF